MRATISFFVFASYHSYRGVLEVFNRLSESKWSALLLPKKEQKLPSNWVGESFKIGEDIFGVPLHSSPSLVDRPPTISEVPWRTAAGHSVLPPSTSLATNGTSGPLSYFTARESPSAEVSSGISASSSLHEDPRRHSGSSGSQAPLVPSSATSSPSRSKTKRTVPKMTLSASMPTIHIFEASPVESPQAGVSRSIFKTPPSSPKLTGDSSSSPLRSALQRSPNAVKKKVGFLRTEAPVPPSDVLSRDPTDVPNTSAGAAASQLMESRRKPPKGAVIRKGMTLPCFPAHEV